MARDDDGKVYRKSLVSPCLKWSLFAFNMFFWIAGVILIAVGVWSFTLTREMNTNTKMGEDDSRDIFDVLFDFTILFMVVGSVMFLLSLFGALGALRENICLLKTFAIILGILFLVEFAMAITVLALSGKAQDSVAELLADKAVKDYRDDINRQNIVDWVQETFECCGVGDKRWRAWEMNPYFNCSSPAFEACAVPYSCCTEDMRVNEFGNTNTRCGHGVLKASNTESDVDQTIYTTGCVDAVINSVQDNIWIVGGVSLGIVIPQLLGIFMARFLWVQVEDQRSQFA